MTQIPMKSALILPTCTIRYCVRSTHMVKFSTMNGMFRLNLLSVINDRLNLFSLSLNSKEKFNISDYSVSWLYILLRSFAQQPPCPKENRKEETVCWISLTLIRPWSSVSYTKFKYLSSNLWITIASAQVSYSKCHIRECSRTWFCTFKL